MNEVVDYYYTQMTDICDKLMSIKDDHIAKKPLIEMRSYLVSQWISYVKTAIESVKILYQLIRENKVGMVYNVTFCKCMQYYSIVDAKGNIAVNACGGSLMKKSVVSYVLRLPSLTGHLTGYLASLSS